MHTTVTENNATAHIYVSAQATAWIDVPSGHYGSAEGAAHATGHIAGSQKYISFSACAYVDQDSDPPEVFDGPDGPYEDDDDRTGLFTQDTGLSCSHDAACYATVEEAGPGGAVGTATARGEGYMYRGS